MTLGLYSAFDTVGKRSICVFASASDGLAVRENAPALSKVIPLGDVQLRKIGEIDDSSLKVTVYDEPVSVSWESYKFPESPILKSQSEVKNER